MQEEESSGHKKVTPPASNGIVNRFLTDEPKISKKSESPSYESKTSKKTLPESPPSYEKDYSTKSSYVGRSSYLKEESRREETSRVSGQSKSKVSSYVAPGLYDNDADREGLRQMLSSLRRDPMDVEDDPDNNDGSFFPCEFCGDPYPCEFLMRHQVCNNLK